MNPTSRELSTYSYVLYGRFPSTMYCKDAAVELTFKTLIDRAKTYVDIREAHNYLRGSSNLPEVNPFYEQWSPETVTVEYNHIIPKNLLLLEDI